VRQQDTSKKFQQWQRLVPAKLVLVNGITYQQCGSTWYQPQYSGSQANYIVVNPPR